MRCRLKRKRSEFDVFGAGTKHSCNCSSEHTAAQGRSAQWLIESVAAMVSK